MAGIVADVTRIAPEAIVFNYTNPMSILTLAAARSTSLPVVGLCHSVQGTSRLLADFLQVPYEELDWKCAGINHNAWFTKLEHNGEDLYPELRRRAADPEIYEQDPVRFEVMLRLGAFVTESSGHFSEYVPYFRKRADLIAKYARAGYLGESGFYANNWPRWRRENDERIHAMLRGESEIPKATRHEYASWIIEAMELGRATSIHGNVTNDGAIDNLPSSGCVHGSVDRARRRSQCSIGHLIRVRDGRAHALQEVPPPTGRRGCSRPSIQVSLLRLPRPPRLWPTRLHGAPPSS